MPSIKQPRSGSLQVWPRKKAKRQQARIRTWPCSNEPKPVGFAGYKAGMTHIVCLDKRPHSLTKNDTITIPVTILECPPLKVAGIILYKTEENKKAIAGQVLAEKFDKALERKLPVPKKTGKKISEIKSDEYCEFRLLVYTQPSLTDIGKKKPEIFELGLGGKPEQQLEFAKNNLGKEIKITDVFKAGEHVDMLAITKGKGTQGPVKRFGIGIRQHKSEKTKRGPGSLGPWHGMSNWTVSHAGQTGYHQRLEHNKWIMLIDEDPKKINIKGGFLRYGVVKNPFMLIKGSIQGPAKRLIKFTLPRWPNRHIQSTPMEITNISLTAKQ